MLRFLRGATHHTKTIWWVLIILTGGSFVFGFVFLLGSGIGGGGGPGVSGTLGTVNGLPITREQFQLALVSQRESYKERYGSEPVDRDAAMVEVQAWRGLVMEKLMADEAKKLGIGARDKEVVLTLQSSPPSMLANQPIFQTDGKFDPAKYQQAMRDPDNNWAPYEDMVREQLPVKKLQERLMASVKLSEPELLEAFHDRYDRATAIVLQVPAAPDSAVGAPTEADLDRVYQEQKGRFTSDARVQLEALIAQKQTSDEEKKAALDLLQSLVTRARGGEDFAALCRDYSEGPNADKGGEVERFFQPDEFGPEMGPKIAAMNRGEVSDPFPDGTRFVAVKLLEKTPAAPPAGPAVKIAQLVIKVRPKDETVLNQYKDLQKLRERARRVGLGRAAAERGLATMRTEWYDFNGSPQALFGVPEAGDWGLTGKLNEVSPVFSGVDEMAIVQVAARRSAGAAPREEVTDVLRQLARMEARVTSNKAAADAVAAALASGQTLEAAAKARGFMTIKLDQLSRAYPDPRLSGAPELVGALFSARPGKVVGPVRGANAWYFGRLEALAVADTATYSKMKGSITQEILQRRQQTVIYGFLTQVRAKAKVVDQRATSQGY